MDIVSDEEIQKILHHRYPYVDKKWITPYGISFTKIIDIIYDKWIYIYEPSNREEEIFKYNTQQKQLTGEIEPIHIKKLINIFDNDKFKSLCIYDKSDNIIILEKIFNTKAFFHQYYCLCWIIQIDDFTCINDPYHLFQTNNNNNNNNSDFRVIYMNPLKNYVVDKYMNIHHLLLLLRKKKAIPVSYICYTCKTISLSNVFCCNSIYYCSNKCKKKFYIEISKKRKTYR